MLSFCVLYIYHDMFPDILHFQYELKFTKLSSYDSLFFLEFL